jgi:hypothetical protein
MTGKHAKINGESKSKSYKINTYIKSQQIIIVDGYPVVTENSLRTISCSRHTRLYSAHLLLRIFGDNMEDWQECNTVVYDFLQ